MAEKKSKAERQAETARIIADARREQAKVGPTIYEGKEDEPLSIDDLLGPDPVPGTKGVTSQRIGKPVKDKSVTPAAPRSVKGKLVAFKTKTGQTIIGAGVLYYVARMGGKLHYKEASQVTILPEDWKEGDPIPGEDMPTDSDFDNLV